MQPDATSGQGEADERGRVLQHDALHRRVVGILHVFADRLLAAGALVPGLPKASHQRGCFHHGGKANHEIAEP